MRSNTGMTEQQQQSAFRDLKLDDVKKLRQKRYREEFGYFLVPEAKIGISA